MNRIKILFFVFLAFLFSPSVIAQKLVNKLRTFYIVRHAEKDTGSNPAISVLGKKRAGDLFRKLKHKKIDLILVSQYRRTGMTGDSLRIYKNIDTMHYTADADGQLLFKKINSLPAHQKNILIIGHSNTLPAIIRNAGITNFTLNEIPDYEYDNLFIVKQRKNKSHLQSKKYGVHSYEPVNATQMNILQ